jgi:putative oxidoreductase
MTGRRSVYHGCRVLLGALFLAAGIFKGRDVTTFAGEIAAYRLLPYALNYLLAATLPYVEVLAGGLLLLGRNVRGAALLTALLTVVFLGAILSAMLRGLEIDCGCFGGAAVLPLWVALVRDVGILVLAHFTYHLQGTRPS